MGGDANGHARRLVDEQTFDHSKRPRRSSSEWFDPGPSRVNSARVETSTGLATAATFARDGINFDLTVVVVTTVNELGKESLTIRPLAVPTSLADNRDRLGEVSLPDGRRWLAYYHAGEFLLASAELTV